MTETPSSSAAAPSPSLRQWRDSAHTRAAQIYEAAHGREIPDHARGFRWRIEPRVAVTLTVAAVLLAATVWAVFTVTGPATLAASPVATPQPSVNAMPEAAVATMISAVPSPSADNTEAVVHVAGAVANPGIVSVPSTARVSDALVAAGGPLEDANLDAVNLARVVTDGEQIFVPDQDGAGAGAGDGVAGAGSGSGGVDGADAPVNLNTASASVLETLPGIGPVTAARIVEDREANGNYASLQDLTRVSGIGPATVANIEGAATV
ncbi:ComEA family DNA-binding protein [Demequina sediminicola]|uniref:ComEA family DNA-binding protein n=1 Tax=Demequina sediminicola TaxID=1095026 RepID=UPI000782A004|nr:ComEA family DNA-binding protein [Demequina sediminicola]